MVNGTAVFCVSVRVCLLSVHEGRFQKASRKLFDPKTQKPVIRSLQNDEKEKRVLWCMTKVFFIT